MITSLFKRVVLFALLLPGAVGASAAVWRTDSLLGAPFESLEIPLPADWSGRERCTVVRLKATVPDTERRAVLYVHGFNDYFFQAQMADSFAAHGYDFYAVDLHRYGRSLLPGQRRCDVRGLDEYNADIDSALAVMRRAGAEQTVLMGHSTGGLIAAWYMAHHPEAPVSCLVLNSPFLDWNMGKLERWIPMVSAVGALFPGITISSGSGDAYGSSLRADRHGEWVYDHNLKSDPSPKVSLGWIHAIDSAQRWLRRHPGAIKVPVLLMYSSASYHGSGWTPDASRMDAVLDVDDIAKYGRALGTDVQPVRVTGGLHDLMLSSADVRRALYPFVFRWLEQSLQGEAR